MKKAFYLGLLMLSTRALAWGTLGHEVVGELAARHLCNKTARAIHDLLGAETLAQAAVWADEVRDQPAFAYLKPWHFVTMPLGSHYQAVPHSPRGDLVLAYHEQMTKLQNPLSPDRLEALRLIVHLAGDAHQPFHAGQHGDYGGNGVQLTWYGYHSNLHQVWDTRMIKQLRLNSVDLATSLDSAVQPAPTQGTPEDWVDESSKIAAQAYPAQDRLGSAYQDRFSPVAKERLREAGLRLAHELNSVFGCP